MATPGKLTLDTREFSKWAAAEIKFSRKDAAGVLNKAAGNVAAKAVSLVTKANYAKLLKKYSAGGWRGKVLPSGKISRGKARKYQTLDPSRVAYAALSYYIKKGRLPSWAPGIIPKNLMGLSKATKVAATYFAKRKFSSIGYIAAGFIMIAKFFGRPMTTKVSDKGWAHESTGEKATPQNLTALLMNFARGADKAPGVRQALQTALDSVTGDIRNHLTQKMAARAKRAGAKVSS